MYRVHFEFSYIIIICLFPECAGFSNFNEVGGKVVNLAKMTQTQVETQVCLFFTSRPFVTYFFVDT